MKKSEKPTKPALLAPPAGTIFDDTYRTMIQKLPVLVIPVINEVFGTDYDERTEYEQLRNEHLELAGKIITDSIFRLGGNLYHLECESNPDGSMIIRMFEYDFAIAMGEARKEDEVHCVKFPLSAVLYLRHNSATPDRLALKVIFPDGQAVTYQIPVIKVQEYTLEEIFRKRLWLFLPYYIMRYEKRFDAMEKDKEERDAMLGELRKMTEKIEEYAKHPTYGILCKDLLQLAKRVADHMLRKQRKTKKEVTSIMGGKILELYSEKMMRKGRKLGRAEGVKKGRAEGVKKGRAEGIEEMALNMLRSKEPPEKIALYSKLTMDRIQELGRMHGLL